MGPALRYAQTMTDVKTQPVYVLIHPDGRAEWGADFETEDAAGRPTCRIMETRRCPPAGRCSGPCARFESDDPTPWQE